MYQQLIDLGGDIYINVLKLMMMFISPIWLLIYIIYESYSSANNISFLLQLFGNIFISVIIIIYLLKSRMVKLSRMFYLAIITFGLIILIPNCINRFYINYNKVKLPFDEGIWSTMLKEFCVYSNNNYYKTVTKFNNGILPLIFQPPVTVEQICIGYLIIFNILFGLIILLAHLFNIDILFISLTGYTLGLRIISNIWSTSYGVVKSIGIFFILLIVIYIQITSFEFILSRYLFSTIINIIIGFIESTIITVLYFLITHNIDSLTKIIYKVMNQSTLNSRQFLTVFLIINIVSIVISITLNISQYYKNT